MTPTMPTTNTPSTAGEQGQQWNKSQGSTVHTGRRTLHACCSCWNMLSLFVVSVPTIGSILVVVSLKLLLQRADDGITIFDRSISQALGRVHPYSVVATPLSVGAALFFLSILIRNIQIDVKLHNAMNRKTTMDNSNNTTTSPICCHGTTDSIKRVQTGDQNIRSNDIDRSYNYSSSSSSSLSSVSVSSPSVSPSTTTAPETTTTMKCFIMVLMVINNISAIINIVSLVGFILLIAYPVIPGQSKDSREDYLHTLGSYIYFGGSVLYGWLHVVIVYGMCLVQPTASCRRARTDSCEPWFDHRCRDCCCYGKNDAENNDGSLKTKSNNNVKKDNDFTNPFEPHHPYPLCDAEIVRSVDFDSVEKGDCSSAAPSSSTPNTSMAEHQEQPTEECHRIRLHLNTRYFVYYTMCTLLMSATGIATTYSTIKYKRLLKDGYQWEWYAVIFASIYMCFYTALFVLDNPFYELHQALESLRRTKTAEKSTSTTVVLSAKLTAGDGSSTTTSSSPEILVVRRKQTADTFDETCHDFDQNCRV